MFCSKCGSNADGLKFCKNCGFRLRGEAEDKDGTPGKMLDNVLTTLFLVVMFGLGILVGLVAVLLGNNVRIEPVVVIVLAYLSVVFGICFSLGRHVTKLIDYKLRGGQAEISDEVRQIPAPTTAQLQEFREPVMSVTDHTTKTLESPVFRER